MSIPESVLREIERAIQAAEFPRGMSVHDGKAKVDSSHLRRLLAELAALRAEKVSQCGHPSSLMLRSAETGKALYCEMCDTRSQLNDAVKMEAHYRERTEKAEAEAARLQAAIEQTRHASYCASRYYDMVGGVKELGNFEVPRPVYRECNCWKAAAARAWPRWIALRPSVSRWRPNV